MNMHDNDQTSRPFDMRDDENGFPSSEAGHLSTAQAPPLSSLLPVCPLSNEAAHSLSLSDAHTLSDAPVHGLSAQHVQIDSTEYAQGMDRQAEQGERNQSAQGLPTRDEHTVNMGNGQGMDTQTEQSENIPEGPAGPRSGDTLPPVVYLRGDAVKWTSNQENVLDFFRNARHCVINHKVLGGKLNIPYGTVRNIIRRLAEAGLIRCEPFREKAIQGIEVWYCGTDKEAPSSAWALKIDRESTSFGQPDRAGHEQPEWTGGAQPPYIKEREIDRNLNQIHKEEEKKKINLSIWNLSSEQIEIFWPNARRAGLFPGHLRDAQAAFEAQQFMNEKSEAIVAQTLRFLDWQLEKGPIIDNAGKKVDDPVLYWLRSLQRNGYYRKPSGYVDHELVALEQLEKEQSEILASKRRIQENEAEMEKQALDEELARIIQGLAEQGEAHPHWQDVYEKLGDWAKGEIRTAGSKAILNPGNCASARIALRQLLGHPKSGV